MPNPRTLLWFTFFLVTPPIFAATLVVNTEQDLSDALPGDSICASASGVCSLRAAVQESNALTGADTIVLSAGIFRLSIAGAGEDAAATGDLDITEDLSIAGNGPTSTIVNA